MITNQEVFNKVWNYFIVEKHPKSTNNMSCMYRSPKGNKCAIGCLIPDEKYNPEWDCGVSITIRELIYKKPSLTEFVGKDLDLLRALQLAHDYSSVSRDFHGDMQEQLELVAMQFKLLVPKVI